MDYSKLDHYSEAQVDLYASKHEEGVKGEPHSVPVDAHIKEVAGEALVQSASNFNPA